MDDALVKAVELADSIRASECYVELQRARERMQNDPETVRANRLYDEILQQTRSRLSRGELTPQQAQKMMQEAKEKRDSVEAIRDYTQKHDAYLQLFDNINQILSTLLGIEARESGCAVCGRCASCGRG